MDEYRETRLDDNDERNKIWYEIYNESTSLLVEIDKVHLKLGELSLPKMSPFRLRKGFNSIKIEGESIYPKLNNWLNRARDFTENPHMVIMARIDDEIDRAVSYLHYVSIIQNRINTLEIKTNNFQRDLYQVWLLVKHRESSFFALIFFSVGIIIAVVSTVIGIIRS